MPNQRPEPPGDPIFYFYREVMLTGGDATRLYLIRHGQSASNQARVEGRLGFGNARRLEPRARGAEVVAEAGQGFVADRPSSAPTAVTSLSFCAV